MTVELIRSRSPRPRHIWRVAALALLLLAAADLTLPQLCAEDSQSLRMAQRQHDSSASVQIVAAPGDLAAAERESSHDCFCCCSHVLSPAVAVHLVAFDLIESSKLVRPVDIAVTFFPAPFHPPRLA
ncbi:MAG TPA: hypothetical protein VKB93_02760 [Thermoanaerobaculia bacterium]|nr:hypothetical protein [Thermoanaerobaculia bacterium]